MGKTLLGIDIGSNDIKMALTKGGGEKLAAERLPENLVRDNRIASYDLMAQQVKQLIKKNGLRTGGCALILPDYCTFFKRLSLPAMSIEELLLNLPYEFRDYVGNEIDNYFYDYAVEKVNLAESGEPTSIDLVAAAAMKAVVREYSDMCRKAGVKLVRALPREMALVNVLKKHISGGGDPQKEYCIIDIGYENTRIYIFQGDSLNASKKFDTGCKQIDEAISAEFNIDGFLAETYRISDHDNALSRPLCQQVYERISVELRKVINFYAYNNQESTLSDIHFCGDGAKIPPLLEMIMRNTGLIPKGLDELIAGKAQEGSDIIRCAMAIGVAL